MDNSNFDPAKAMHLQPAEQLDLKTQTPLPLQESRAVNNAASNFPRQSQGDIKFWQPPVCHGSTGPQSSIAACSDEKIISNLIDASRVSGSSNCLEDEKSRINRSARKRLLEEPPSIRVSGKRQMPKSVGIVPQAGGNMPVPEAEPKQPLAYLDYSCHVRGTQPLLHYLHNRHICVYRLGCIASGNFRHTSADSDLYQFALDPTIRIIVLEYRIGGAKECLCAAGIYSNIPACE